MEYTKTLSERINHGKHHKRVKSTETKRPSYEGLPHKQHQFEATKIACFEFKK